jgi:hypothetical protein
MTNALFCTKCNSFRVYSNNDCICPSGGFTEMIPAQISCASNFFIKKILLIIKFIFLACSSLCATCQIGNPNFCTSCYGNRDLDNGLCKC